jgi:hypothetical protein
LAAIESTLSCMSTDEEREKIIEQLQASAPKPETIMEQARTSRALDKPPTDIQPIRDNRVIEEILRRLDSAERRITELENAAQESVRPR